MSKAHSIELHTTPYNPHCKECIRLTLCEIAVNQHYDTNVVEAAAKLMEILDI